MQKKDSYSLLEKNVLYNFLVNYGIPVSDFDEQREDYELLRVLLQKEIKGTEAIPEIS